MPAMSPIKYKFVIQRVDGRVDWELGEVMRVASDATDPSPLPLSFA